MVKVYVVSRLERNYKDDWDTSSEKVFHNKEDAAKFIQEGPNSHDVYLDWEEVDIIYPADMQVTVSDENEQLRAAAKLALEAFYKCVKWSGTTDFDHEIDVLEAALDKLTREK